MSLEQAIHQRWAANAALSALLPPERLTTGRSGGGDKPYATLLAAERRNALATNAGNAIREVEIELCLWHDGFDAGEEIVEYVQAVFNMATFELPDGSATVRMREASMTASQEADGVWCWKMKFTAKLCAVFDV